MHVVSKKLICSCPSIQKKKSYWKYQIAIEVRLSDGLFLFTALSVPSDKITREQGSKISSELVTGDTFEMHSAGHLKWIWTQSRYIWIQAIRSEQGLCSVMVVITVLAKDTVLLLLLPQTNTWLLCHINCWKNIQNTLFKKRLQSYYTVERQTVNVERESGGGEANQGRCSLCGTRLSL